VTFTKTAPDGAVISVATLVKASKVENAKAAIAARRALKRKAEADKRERIKAVDDYHRGPLGRVTAVQPKFITAFGHTFPAAGETPADDLEARFLARLTHLCNELGFTISGCGCCGSPYLSKLGTDERLIGYTNENSLVPRFAAKPALLEADEGLGIGLRSLKRDY
jgi:hypothetical protein